MSITPYRADSLRIFNRRPYGTVYASEFNLNEGRHMHLRSQGIPATMEDLMNGRAGIQKGTTSGHIFIDRDVGLGDIKRVEISYHVGPFNDERYTIDNEGSFRVERVNMGFDGRRLSIAFFEGTVDPTGLFMRIQKAASELREGNDVEIYNLIRH
jgi:hypothetical protein